MAVDLAAAFGAGPGPRKVVANLPYNLASALVVALLEPPLGLRRLVVTVQREVAERMPAAPGSKDYGILSVAVQYRAELPLLPRLPASAFSPPPGVADAVAGLD